MITQSLKFCTEQVRATALAWIRTRPRLFQTHYLLTCWLNQGLPPEDVRAAVGVWLKTDSFRNPGHATTLRASFVYRAWLDACGTEKTEADVVREAIREWLAEHRNKLDAQFVYRAWLDAWGKYEGEADLVREAIHEWLAEHSNEPEARFVYRAWLDARGKYEGEADLVREAIRDWLAQHSNELEARFVYQAWMDARGKYDEDAKLVREAIRDWLAQHSKNVEAQFVYRAWLDARGKYEGEADLVREAIREWLAEHSNKLETQFVYRAWLDARGKYEGEADLVRDAIRQWLQVESNAVSVEADYILRAWFETTGEIEEFRRPFERWILLHAGSDNIDFVCAAWLKGGGEYAVVAEAAEAWLKRFGTEYRAVYLWKYAARQRALAVDLIRTALDWCGTHCADPDAIWRLAQLRDHLLRPAAAEAFINASDKVLGRMFQHGIHPPVTKLIMSVLFYLIQAASESNRKRVEEFLVTSLRRPDVFAPYIYAPIFVQEPHFVQAFADLFTKGLGDEDSVPRFLQWVNVQWAPERKRALAPVLDRLREVAPERQELWDLIDLR